MHSCQASKGWSMETVLTRANTMPAALLMSWIPQLNHSGSTYTFPTLQQTWVLRFSVACKVKDLLSVIHIKHPWLKHGAADDTGFLKLSVIIECREKQAGGIVGVIICILLSYKHHEKHKTFFIVLQCHQSAWLSAKPGVFKLFNVKDPTYEHIYDDYIIL